MDESSSERHKRREKWYPDNGDGRVPVSLDEAHSPSKVLAHPENLKRYLRGEKVHPLHIRMGLTGACNMRCEFCNFHSDREASFYDRFSYKDAIATGEAIRFLEEFAGKGGKAVTLCGSGENTVHQGYQEICRAARAAGLKVGMITNGVKLHEPEIRDCISATHTWVRIGMNAGNAETFARVTNFKKPGAFQRMLDSIRPLSEGAIEPDFQVGLNFVVTLANANEMIDAVRHAKDAGASYLRFEPEFYTEHGHETIHKDMSLIEENFQKAKEYENEGFRVSIPKINRGRMRATSSMEGDFGMCHYSRFVTALGADGQMYPCPQVHLNGDYALGDAVKDGYKNWEEQGNLEGWETDQTNRRELCMTCFYRPQNELLEWLKKGDVSVDEVLADFEDYDFVHPDFV